MMVLFLPQHSIASRCIEMNFILLVILPVLESARISPQFTSGSQSFNSFPSRQQLSSDNLQLIPRFSSPSSGSAVSNLNAQNFPPSSSSSAVLNMNPLSFPGMGKLRVLSVLFSGMRNTGLESTIAGEVLQRVIKTSLKDILVPFKQQVFSRFS